jgi:N12 class adenine-specific DNA methylase
LCLDERGHLDLGTIARLLAISPGQVPAALGDLAYLDPAERRWVPADEYLSGDVREKLDVARAAAAREPDRYAANLAQPRSASSSAPPGWKPATSRHS